MTYSLARPLMRNGSNFGACFRSAENATSQKRQLLEAPFTDGRRCDVYVRYFSRNEYLCKIDILYSKLNSREGHKCKCCVNNAIINFPFLNY